MATLAIANEYGNVPVSEMPKNYIHVDGERLQPLCRKLGIKYADAMVGWGGTKRYPKPVLRGVVVLKTSAPRLITAIKERSKRTSTTKKPTEQQREAAKERRQQKDIARFSEEIRNRFPAMPEGLEDRIASHACQIGSGRVGRSSTAENATTAAVIAYVRHNHTEYDALLASGLNRDDARDEVASDISSIIDQWQKVK